MEKYLEFINPYTAESGNVFLRAEHLARYLFAARHIHKHKLERVLDTACGNGYGSMLLARHATTVLGLERNGSLVEKGCNDIRLAQMRNVSLQSADLNESLPLDDDAFDCVVCFETLEHVEKDAELVAEFSRVVRRCGVLMLSVPKEGYEKRTEDGKPDNPFHLRLYNEKEICKLVEVNGFRVEEVLGQPYSNAARVRMEDYRRDKGLSAEEAGAFFADTKEALDFYAQVWAWPVRELPEKSNVLILVCKKLPMK